VRKEQEKKDMEDVVEQDKLVEIRNRRPFRLDNIYMRPAMESKRIGGRLSSDHWCLGPSVSALPPFTPLACALVLSLSLSSSHANASSLPQHRNVTMEEDV
jgi:hypothetical protein